MSVIGLTWAGVATAATVAAAAVSIGGKVLGGLGASSDENKARIAEAKAAAEEYKEAKVGMLNTQYGTTVDKLNLTADNTAEKSSLGANKNLTDLVGQVQNVTAKSNMATNQSVAKMQESASGDIYSAYNTSIESAVGARDLGIKSAGTTRDLSIADAELDYADRMADIEAEPDDFWEGMYA
tara:strand:+ start:2054 stop:2599 length:546 start_codon:yes stop_codon:yes gene_type:complete